VTKFRSRIAILVGVLVLGLGAFAIAEQIEGTDEPDTIEGTEEADQITGERGDDTINGLGGDDTIHGGQDSVSRSRLGGDGNDKIDGGDGNDTLNGGGERDIVKGGEGNDKVFGAGCQIGSEEEPELLGRICDNVGRDKLIGGPGDDDLRANECSDSPDCQEATNISLGTHMAGGSGNDQFLGAERRDRVRGGADDDNAQGFLGSDPMRGGPGNDTLDGGDGRDRLVGGRGNDTIEARDGKRDRVNCGKGRKDRAFVDSKDRVSGCEDVVGVG
jgi:Ca2+-binding RTX toxin-like protein